MKRFLLVALFAAALSTSGCCRGWFIWPGHYPHNPAFSQCCEPPWGPPDPFGRAHAGAGPGWGHGTYEGGEGGGGGDQCCYHSCGISDWFGGHEGDCGCNGGQPGYPPGGCGCGGGQPGYPPAGCCGGGGPPGYPPGAGGYPGMNNGMYGPPGGPGPGPGMYGPGPGAYGAQPAPDAMSAAQIAYPYYTNRGPRDFFLGYPPGSRPPSIGP